jgi:hypothetical protein
MQDHAIMHDCPRACPRARTQAPARARTCTWAHICVGIHRHTLCTRMCSHVHTYEHTLSYKHNNVHTQTQMCTQAYFSLIFLKLPPFTLSANKKFAFTLGLCFDGMLNGPHTDKK